MEIFSGKATSLILLLLVLTASTVTTADLTSQELDAALFALRSSGYTLFPNAITTSDLLLRLLSSQNSSSFTLFAPTDSLLFSLDLLSSSRLYTFSLLLHASPHFLSMSDLLSLPRPNYIETLLPNRQLFVENTLVSHNGTFLLSVTVDGVRVSVPDLFLGSNIAVHGLDGILVARYGSRVGDGTGFAEAPKGWCERETCISPANPPDIWPPMGSGAPEMVTGHTGIKKDGGSDHDDDSDTTKGSRHGIFFRFKRLFTP
ncbi:fasciclin-like arabinogalactan protein 19 [Durio zibethinus]|uniref:Fasciclin-like arabinogalactan protein 19 n=1 Tax=Durio zibethinus TaxID=66656 RepID=A0A6P5ZHJ7_DURZI|nr:fasciclin-like arabinogalactan protein 19 [Durio zibethinus]